MNLALNNITSLRGASHQIVRLIEQDVFSANISVALALEYEEVLKRADLLRGLTGAEIDGFLDFLFQTSELVRSVFLNRPNLSDPAGDLILDLAYN